jgi:hypothetical protein
MDDAALQNTTEIIRQCCSRAHSQMAPGLASLILARITRDQRGSLVRPGTSSAGAVCRAAELQADHERSPQIPR